MADLIDRATLLAAGDARKMKDALGDWDALDNKTKIIVLRYAKAHKKLVESVPAVDAVPVVRCKDCKFLWKKNMLCVHPKRLQGMIAFCECEENDYCSYGERKET
jgi:hypothetical protein